MLKVMVSALPLRRGRTCGGIMTELLPSRVDHPPFDLQKGPDYTNFYALAIGVYQSPPRDQSICGSPWPVWISSGPVPVYEQAFQPIALHEFQVDRAFC